MGTLSMPEIGKENDNEDPKILAALEALNAILGAENKIKGAGVEDATITAAKLAAGAAGFRWYTPKAIATEESTESATFTTLTTADEIKSVVLPENGLVLVGYQAMWKTTSEAGIAGAKAAIFVGANQLKVASNATTPSTTTGEAAFVGGDDEGVYKALAVSPTGLVSQAPDATPYGGDVTTGQALALSTSNGTDHTGPCWIFAAAGTYDISVKYKSPTGKTTAKARKLWVAVLGA